RLEQNLGVKRRPTKKVTELQVHTPSQVARGMVSKSTADDAPGKEDSPVVVFLNSKSGGQMGGKVLKAMTSLIGSDHVFDLQEVVEKKWSPEEKLEQFKGVTGLKVLICGGDGTMGWILSCIDRLGAPEGSYPVAMMPLGTGKLGNDLARSFRWGPGFSPSMLTENFLDRVKCASPVQLDRWLLSVMPYEPIFDSAKAKATVPPTFTIHKYDSMPTHAEKGGGDQEGGEGEQGATGQRVMRMGRTFSERMSSQGMNYSRSIHDSSGMLKGAWSGHKSDSGEEDDVEAEKEGPVLPAALDTELEGAQAKDEQAQPSMPVKTTEGDKVKAAAVINPEDEAVGGFLGDLKAKTEESAAGTGDGGDGGEEGKEVKGKGILEIEVGVGAEKVEAVTQEEEKAEGKESGEMSIEAEKGTVKGTPDLMQGTGMVSNSTKVVAGILDKTTMSDTQAVREETTVVVQSGKPEVMQVEEDEEEVLSVTEVSAGLGVSGEVVAVEGGASVGEGLGGVRDGELVGGASKVKVEEKLHDSEEDEGEGGGVPTGSVGDYPDYEEGDLGVMLPPSSTTPLNRKIRPMPSISVIQNFKSWMSYDAVFCNYFSFGVDAIAASAFHTHREEHPELFTSRLRSVF
ncbi:unnamed protein product, partial [Choristocarpus tenellus]